MCIRDSYDGFSLFQHGTGRYTATECGIKYEVGANTFIQVNSGVCRKLYDRTVKAAAESGCTAAIDCYSGGGLMTAMLAKTLGKAYGIEIVREAVDCADGLKSLNKLQDKMSNRCGKVEDILPSVLEEVDADQCFLVVDPPRTGCLLYTSPSPRDMRRSRMPSSA